MNLLRKEDYPHAKFPFAFVKYGSEKGEIVIEFIDNWDKILMIMNLDINLYIDIQAIRVKDIHLICQGLENNGCKVTTKPKSMKNRTTVLAFVEDSD